MTVNGISWLKKEFTKVNLGDERLNKRCQETVEKMALKPGKSIPHACEDWGSTKGAYRFLSNKKVDREKILRPHIEQTKKRCHQEDEVIAIHDVMYANFTNHESTTGLGPIGTAPHLRGLLVFNTLAVSLQKKKALGFLYQEVWARPKRGHAPGETQHARRKRERESEVWPRGLSAVRSLGLKEVIHVSDRESDIYEVLETADREGQRYVIRSCRNRRMEKAGDYIWDAVRRGRLLGKMSVRVSARAGQKAREAQLSLRRAEVTIRPPSTVVGGAKNITLSVVEAIEEHAPRGSSALRWILLTKEPTQTLSACMRVVDIYSCRWKVEELHMGLKTGCSLEKRQMETREGLESFLGLASVISVMLLRMRDAARGEGNWIHYLTEIQWICLRRRYPSLPPNPTVRDALRAVARLGGFLARKGDGEPGWRTLWAGMEKLLFMEHGYLLALKRHPLLVGTPQICG